MSIFLKNWLVEATSCSTSWLVYVVPHNLPLSPFRKALLMAYSGILTFGFHLEGLIKILISGGGSFDGGSWEGHEDFCFVNFP